MRTILDVVYAADHSYMFYCCVSIFSLMEQIPASRQVRLHLLTDESFQEEDERLFSFLAGRFENLQLQKHLITEEAFEKRSFEGSLWSKAACYRLLLPNLLKNVDLCLYLDSDTLVVGNIEPLWETDLSGYSLAGVFQNIAPVRSQTVGDQIPGLQTYVNSGVLLMNLELMRRRNLQETLLRGISDYLLVDQDLLNVVCYGSIQLLPPEYNVMAGTNVDAPKILHFHMRDYLRPWVNPRSGGAVQWWNTAREFDSVYDLDSLRRQADWYQRGSIRSIFGRCADYERIYVVGSGNDAERIFRALRLGKCRGLQGILKETDAVFGSASAEEKALPGIKDTLLICASRKREVPVLQAFLAAGASPDQILRFSRWPASFYHAVPKHCEREVSGELMMWEYGVDHMGVSTCTSLLEINAVRFPGKEALVEWRDGVRSAHSYGELNRMANRMADRIGRKKLRRGAIVKLPESSCSAAEQLAAVLGIIKSGHAASLADNLQGRAGHNEEQRPGVTVGHGDARSPKDTEGLMADLSALTDESCSFRAPSVETLPEEGAVWSGGEAMTNQKLCLMAEKLRRSVGWHALDTLLICSRTPVSYLAELTAAFAWGNTVIVQRDPDGRKLREAAEREKATIVCMDTEAFERIAGNPESLEPVPASWRIVMTGACIHQAEKPLGQEDLSEAVDRWKRHLPQISVNGLGYEGKFSYEGRWF